MGYEAKRFGARLRALRGDRTQEELALAVGVSRETYVQMETGSRKRWPDPDIINGLSRELTVPVATLLRAAGADLPQSDSEELDWLASQLDEDGLDLLAELGRALLPRHRRRPQTAQSPPPTLRAVAEERAPYDSSPPPPR